MSINSFTFDGVSSEDIGLYVGGQKTFGAPQRDVTKVSIPGRNGDLVRDNGRFLNSEIAYNIVAMNDFKETAQNVRNWLMSAKGYKRLEDTYHPEHYRMARVSGGIDFETGAYNATGKAQILFDCMPQRYLKSGEEVSDASMVNRTESGDMLSFETIKELPLTSAEVTLSPIQSLNGYDSPWAAGAGKNKFPLYTTQTDGVTITASDDGKVIISGTTSTDKYFDIYVNYSVSSGEEYHIAAFNPIAGDSRLTLFMITSIGNDQVNLNTANAIRSRTFADTGTVTRLRLRVPKDVQFSDFVLYPYLQIGGTAPTAFSPYSNICPISGHTGAELNVTGKNLLDASSLAFTSGIRNDNGAQTASANSHYSSEISVKGNTTYTLSGLLMITGTAYRVYFLTNTKGWISRTAQLSSEPYTFTTNAECGYIQIQCANTIDLTEAMLELGSTATAYEPYQGDTYSVTFTDQGTVYGGAYDFVSGDGQSKMASYDLAGRTWTMETFNGNNVFSCNAISTKALNYNFLCNKYKNAETYRSLLQNGECGCYNNTNGRNRISICDNNFSTVEDFVASIADIQFVYELATPIEIDLDPTEVQTLLGLNNVWSDGTVTLTYTEPSVIENPTPFESKPLIRVYGSGTCTVTINNQIITINNVTDFVDIDCETMNCYNGVVNKNADVVLGAQGFPVLPAGETMIETGGGTTKVEITPRWWEL